MAPMLHKPVRRAFWWTLKTGAGALRREAMRQRGQQSGLNVALWLKTDQIEKLKVSVLAHRRSQVTAVLIWSCSDSQTVCSCATGCESWRDIIFGKSVYWWLWACCSNQIGLVRAYKIQMHTKLVIQQNPIKIPTLGDDCPTALFSSSLISYSRWFCDYLEFKF